MTFSLLTDVKQWHLMFDTELNILFWLCVMLADAAVHMLLMLCLGYIYSAAMQGNLSDEQNVCLSICLFVCQTHELW